jgi:serralysin
VDGSFLPNSGDDTLGGGNGNDGLWGFDGNDVINGNAGDDYAEGGLGNDSISGGADNDTLLGQAGADTIGGGTGFDYLYGGADADVFAFNKGDSFDTVWDFSAAEGDKLRIDPALAGSFTAFQSRLSGFNFNGDDFTVFLSADGLDQLTIKGIASTAWTADLLVA